MNIITQPYKRPVGHPALDNFASTMETEVDLPALVESAGMTGRVSLEGFLDAHPNGLANIWAMQEGRRSVWRKMTPDDLVLFYGNGQVYAYGYVTAKVHWPGNSYIWPSGSDWDLIYSMRDVTIIPEANRLPTMELRSVLKNFVPQPAQYHDLCTWGLTLDQAVDQLFTWTGHVPRPEGRPISDGE